MGRDCTDLRSSLLELTELFIITNQLLGMLNLYWADSRVGLLYIRCLASEQEGLSSIPHRCNLRDLCFLDIDL